MLLRLVAIAATLALVMPTLAIAEQNNQHQKSGSKPPAGGGKPPAGVAGKPAFRQGGTPGGARTVVQPHGGPQRAVIGPRPGLASPGGPQFTWHGREFHRVHLAPFVYPSGWGYRRWAVGAVLPPLFLTADYYYADWATLGLDPPQPGFQWVRYGPDLLLVNVTTGEVVDTIYDAFE
ncbi:MAG: RcnB family protein [Xanthobacteraceae bacterium]